jgi:hypothetical protein
MQSRAGHLCRRVSEVRTHYEKKCKYELLALARHIINLTDIYRRQLLSMTETKVTRPMECGIRLK